MQDEKAARRAELDRQLPNLWNAIVDATRSEEAFWLGEILLSEIVKETGYKGPESRQEKNEREMAEGTRCNGSCNDGLPCCC